ncbi:MAG: hypothetical protein KGI52_07450 [Burkholderiales bacterium]|nr:hypothetical protein [Burkholderiales bacterium]
MTHAVLPYITLRGRLARRAYVTAAPHARPMRHFLTVEISQGASPHIVATKPLGDSLLTLIAAEELVRALNIGQQVTVIGNLYVRKGTSALQFAAADIIADDLRPHGAARALAPESEGVPA